MNAHNFHSSSTAMADAALAYARSRPPPHTWGLQERRSSGGAISGRVYDDRAQRTSERLARLHVLEARLAQLTSLSAEEDAGSHLRALRKSSHDKPRDALRKNR